MSIAIKMRLISTLVSNPSTIRIAESKYLFIVSHMRSRSSLLAHIIGSSEAVCGHGELHISYRRPSDLIKTRVRLRGDLGCRLKGKYLLDKILHDRYVLSERVLESASPKVIFLLRDAESTVKSIINLGHITGVDWYKDPERASEYYCARLSNMERCAEAIGGDFFFVESDDLVDKTDSVLRSLTAWLGLDEPLASEYSVFNDTGTSCYGDPSDHILAGRVVKAEECPEAEVSKEIIEKAVESYKRCRASLLRLQAHGTSEARRT